MRTDMVETKHEPGLGVTSLARERMARAGRRVTRRTPAGQVVLAYLDQQAARLGSLEVAVRRGEPDAVHQMRVTIRRLRSVLRSYQTILAGTATRHLSDELKGPPGCCRTTRIASTGGRGGGCAGPGRHQPAQRARSRCTI